MAYVYRHRSLKNHYVFYIGMSKSNKNYNRATTIHSRNKLWSNIVKKYGFYYQIIADNISIEEAFELEQLLIKEYGRKDLKNGCLSNMSDGGEGNFNYKPTAKKCKDHSEKMKGKNNSFYNKRHSEDTKNKISKKAKERLKNKENHPLWGRKYNNEERDIFRGPRPKMLGGKNPNSKKVINTYSKEIFDTVHKAAESIGVSAANLGVWLKTTNPTNFLFLKDYKGEIFYPERKPPYRFKSFENNEIIKSVKDIMKITNLSREKILYKVSKMNLQGFEILIKTLKI